MASKVLKISAHSSISTEYCLTLRNNNHCKQCSLKCVQGDTSETRISLSTPHFLGACGTWADKPQPNKHLLERKWFTTQIYNKYQHFATITSKYLWELYECCCLFKTWCPNLWVGDVDSCSVVAFFADVEAASWIRICSACVVFSCVLQSVCSVFNVQCVGSLFAPRLPRRQHIGQAQCGKKGRIWIPCHQGTHHQHLQCRQHLIRIWTPCWHQPNPQYHSIIFVPWLFQRSAQNRSKCKT